MFRQSKDRGLEGRSVVALLAAIFPRCAGKLSLMLICVAVNTVGKLDLEFRVFA